MGNKTTEEKSALPMSARPAGWVACGERLPTDKHCYYYCIIAKSNGVVMEATFNGKTRRFHTTMFKEIKNHPVTHWMELPKPPNRVITGK